MTFGRVLAFPVRVLAGKGNGRAKRRARRLEAKRFGRFFKDLWTQSFFYVESGSRTRVTKHLRGVIQINEVEVETLRGRRFGKERGRGAARPLGPRGG